MRRVGWDRLFARLLGRPEPLPVPSTVEAFRFDTVGWREVKKASEISAAWTNDDGDVLALEIAFDTVNVPPLFSESLLRQYCRQVAEADGCGIVSVEKVDVGIVSAVQFIFKRQLGSGYLYKGMMVIPAVNAV
jgi:hypothetical protein